MMHLRAAVRGVRLVAVLMVALATTLAGAAHAPSRPAQPLAGLVAYALPDGSLPEICTGGHTDPSGDADHGRGACLVACVLGAMPGLGHDAPVSDRLASVTRAVLLAPEMPAAPRPVWRAARARAPPQGMLAG